MDGDSRVVGLTSFGLGCGSDTPAVYADVSVALYFIAQNVPDWNNTEACGALQGEPS